MKNGLLFLLFLVLQQYGWAQDSVAVFNYETLLNQLPAAAFPVSPEERMRSYHKQYDSSAKAWFQKVNVAIPKDSSVQTTYGPFHLNHKDKTREDLYLNFKIYTTPKDTFLISVCRAQNINPSFFMIAKVYQMHAGYVFDEITMPTLKPTDFARAPKDSVLIAQLVSKGKASFYANFEYRGQAKGLYFYLTDHTLNIGPFEPPITRLPKYFSDYQTHGRTLAYWVTPKGVVCGR